MYCDLFADIANLILVYHSRLSSTYFNGRVLINPSCYLRVVSFIPDTSISFTNPRTFPKQHEPCGFRRSQAH